MINRLCTIIFFVSLIVLPTAGRCQSGDLLSQLAGQASGNLFNPNIRTLGDIGARSEHWYIFQLADSSESSAYMLAAAMFGSSNSRNYYTTGQKVTIGDSEYLVAYQTLQKPFSYQDLIVRSQPTPPKTPLSAADIVRPALLNLHNIPGMVDIHPFDLQEVIASSTQSANTLNQPLDENRQEAQNASNLNNAKQVLFGVAEYVQSNDEKFPPMDDRDSFKKAIYPYIKSNYDFLDVETGEQFYVNHWLSKKGFADINDAGILVAIYSDPHPDGKRVVGYADSHVELLDEAQWNSAKAASHIP